MPSVKAQIDQLDTTSMQLRGLNQGDLVANAQAILGLRTTYLKHLDELNKAVTAHPGFDPDSDNGLEWIRRFREARHGIAAHQVAWGLTRMQADPAGYRDTSRQLGQLMARMYDWLRAHT